MIFLDTSTLVAFANSKDVHHTKAKEIFAKIAEGVFGPAVISDYVFDEAVTVSLARSKSRKTASEFGNHMLSTMDVLKVHDHIFEESWTLFCGNSKGLSFTDCTNLILMKHLNIKKIATFDKGFLGIKGIEVVS